MFNLPELHDIPFYFTLSFSISFKLYYSLRQPVNIPFQGTATQLSNGFCLLFIMF